MVSQQSYKKILGIDPGTNILGYAIMSVEGKKLDILSMGVVRLNKYPDHYTKLQKIAEKLGFLIKTHVPDEMAIEAPFFGKNVQSMLKLGRAQGVAIATAMLNEVPVTEYSPKKVKQSITGNGNASKPQIAAMVQHLLKMDKLPKYFDATDALGVAICHYLQGNSILGKAKGQQYSDWSSFIKDNPGRVK